MSNKEARRLGTKGKRSVNYWLLYTAAFAVMMGLAFSPFWANGRTLISSGDSVNQFYPATIYIGRWYRQALQSILHGNFQIPMFDPGIVLGENTVGLMTYLNLGNPLFWITALIPERWMYLFFQWSIPMQYYLAGISFSLLCFYLKLDRWPTLTATLVYLSCGYVFKTGAMYITFLSPLVYLPLLVLGFEAVLQKRSILPLVFAAWFAGLNDVYFFYMCCILLVLYGVIRGIQLYGRQIQQWFAACLRGVGAVLLGMMLAAPFLLPQIRAFFASSRSGSANLSAALLVPSMERLKKLLFDSWMLNEGPQRNNIALCCIAVLAVLLAVRYCKRWPALCAGTLVMAVLYLIPFTDYLMNALADAYDRWVFLIAFVWALAVGCLFPVMLQLRRGDKILLLAAAAAGAAYALLGPQRTSSAVWASAGMLALTVGVILLIQKKSPVFRQWGPVLLCAAVLLNGAAIGYWHYADGLDGFAGNGFEAQQAKDSVRSAYEDFPLLHEGAQKNSRINNPTGTINASMLEGYSGIRGYWSLLTGDMVQGLQKMGVMAPGWHLELQDKSALVQALLGVRWSIDPAPGQLCGWNLTAENNGHSLYEDPHALPVAGFIYPQAITMEELEQLGPVERQQMALKAIALEEIPQNMPHAQTELAQPLEMQTSTENLLCENGTVNLAWWNGTMQLNLTAPAGTRLLLCLDGLQQVQPGIGISAACGDNRAVISAGETMADYVMDLGYSDAERTQIQLDFSASQNFEQETDLLLKEIRVYALPEAAWKADRDLLGSSVLQNVSLEQNRIAGTAVLDQPGVLCITYPYSSGWKACVDGKPARVEKGSGMFLALALEPGTHTVELTYCTPGLKLGWALLGCGAVVLLICCGYSRKKRRAGSRPAKQSHENACIHRDAMV